MARGNMVRSVIRSLGTEVGAEHVARCAVSEAVREDPTSAARIADVLPPAPPPAPWARVHEQMLRALLLEHGWTLESVLPQFEVWTHTDWEGSELIVPTDTTAGDYRQMSLNSFRAFVMLEHGSAAARAGLEVANHLSGLTT